MLWAAPYLLAVVTSATPAASNSRAPASTYDQAACDEQDEVAPPVEEPGVCAEAAKPAAPTVIDCNDPGMSVWLAEMIGSCDMPRPSPLGLRPQAIAPARGAVQVRSCDALGCARDAIPIRQGGSSDDDRPSALTLRLTLPRFATSTLIVPLRQRRLPAPHPDRLERPPRA